MPSLKDIYKKIFTVADVIQAKGDLVSKDGTQITRLPVGSDQQVLMADSNSSLGLTWATIDVGYAVVNASFTQPALNNTVTISVSTTRWMNVGMFIYIETGGVYEIISIVSANSVTVRNSYSENANQGTTINIIRRITPAGRRGVDGNNAYTTTSSNFVVPAVNSSVTVNVVYTSWVLVGQVIFVEGAGYYRVDSKTSTSLTISNLGYDFNANQGVTIVQSKTVASSGVRGENGISPVSYTTASATMPSINGTVALALSETRWLGIEQHLYLQSVGAFRVEAVTTNTATLMNIGGSGNLVGGSSIPSNTKVVPSGITGASGSNALVTSTTSSFAQPVVNNTVAIAVSTTEFLVVDSYVYIEQGGYYQVVAINSPTNLTVRNLGRSGNASQGVSITANKLVVPSSQPGADGTNGTNGINGLNAYARTTTPFVVPALQSTQIVSIDNPSWLTLNQLVFVEGNTLSVTNISGNSVTLRNIFDSNVVGQAIPSNSLAVTGAREGINAYSFVSTSFVMPDNSSPVVVTLNRTNWLAPNLSIFIATAGYFLVQSVASTTVTLIPYPDPLNASPATIINIGSIVTSAGPRGSDASDIAVALQLNIQGNNPAPVANKFLLYAKSDGIYQVDENGIVSKVGDNEVFILIQGNGVDLPLQPKINFIGDLVNVTNDVSSSRTNVAISSGLATLGDLLYHNGTLLARLPRGNNGQVLSSNSTSGLTWITPSTGVTSYNDLTDKPTLGTASALNVGTATNNVVQLIDSGGVPKLPAVDGSLLTNLPSGIGNMIKSVYDTNDNGIVDSAESISGSPSSNHYYGTNDVGSKGFYPLNFQLPDIIDLGSWTP